MTAADTTVYLIRYNCPIDGELWAWRAEHNHYPWLLPQKERDKWAKIWRKQQKNPPANWRDEATLLQLCAFASEESAQKYAADCHPGALADGKMSFVPMTIAEIKTKFDIEESSEIRRKG